MLQCRDCWLESYITGLHITGGAGVGGGRGGEGGGGGGGGRWKYIYIYVYYLCRYISILSSKTTVLLLKNKKSN